MRSKWEGVCYDGPLEGRRYTSLEPWFRCALPTHLSVFDISRLPDAMAVGHIGLYIWSAPLRKWVFDWQASAGGASYGGSKAAWAAERNSPTRGAYGRPRGPY